MSRSVFYQSSLEASHLGETLVQLELSFARADDALRSDTARG